jgi:hypothetical protein
MPKLGDLCLGHAGRVAAAGHTLFTRQSAHGNHPASLITISFEEAEPIIRALRAPPVASLLTDFHVGIEKSPIALVSVSACPSQYVIPISRYIVVAVVRYSLGCPRLPVRNSDSFI